VCVWGGGILELLQYFCQDARAGRVQSAEPLGLGGTRNGRELAHRQQPAAGCAPVGVGVEVEGDDRTAHAPPLGMYICD
jgi:hypothetical protein